jgi:hypothetical protein
MLNRVYSIVIPGVAFVVKAMPWLAHLTRGGSEQFMVSILMGSYHLLMLAIRNQKQNPVHYFSEHLYSTNGVEQ